MKRKFVALLVAMVLAFGVSNLFASPAQASTEFGCADNTVCLYQWTNFGAGRWGSTFYNLTIHSGGCINLTSPMAYWPNGTQVPDNSGSLVVNGSGAYSTQWYVSFYNWINCNSGGGITAFNANWFSSVSDLSTLSLGAGTAYHTISSVRIEQACPPLGC